MMIKTTNSSPYFDELRKRREEERQISLAELEDKKRRDQAQADLLEARRYAEGQQEQLWARQDTKAQEAEDKAASEKAQKEQEELFARQNMETLSRAATGQWAEFDPTKLDDETNMALADPNYGTFGVKAKYDQKRDIFYIQGTDQEGKDVPQALQTIPNAHVWLEAHGVKHGYEAPPKATGGTGAGGGAGTDKGDKGQWGLVEYEDGKKRLEFLTPETRAGKKVTPVDPGFKTQFDDRTTELAGNIARSVPFGEIPTKGSNVTADTMTAISEDFYKALAPALRETADAEAISAGRPIPFEDVQQATRIALKRLRNRYGSELKKIVKGAEIWDEKTQKRRPATLGEWIDQQVTATAVE